MVPVGPNVISVVTQGDEEPPPGVGTHGLKFNKERGRKNLHSTGKKELTLAKLVSESPLDRFQKIRKGIHATEVVHSH